jgi:peptide/nickel transport system permease protein
MTVSSEPDSAARAPSRSRGRAGARAGAILGGLVMVAVTFLGLMAITFFIGRIIPIDPVLAVVGDRASQETYDAMRLKMGLDQPLIVQFGTYVGSVLRGDFGMSITTGRPVAEDLIRVFPATFELATIGILIGVVLGLPMGVLAAYRQGTWVDQTIRVLGLIGYAVPAFWLALVALAVFYAGLGWAAPPGAHQHLLRRARAGAHGRAPPRRRARRAVGRVLERGAPPRAARADPRLLQPRLHLAHDALAHARPARAGVPDDRAGQGRAEWRVVWVHAFRPILVPLVTVIGLSYAGPARRVGADRDGVLLAGARQLPDHGAPQRRHGGGAGGHAGDRAIFVIINRLSDLLYRRARRAEPVAMSRAVDWLTDTAPASRMQANLGRAYALTGALSAQPAGRGGLVIIVALIVAAAFAPLIAPYAPNAQNLANRLKPPSAAHWMGTDELGRDILSRVIYGARITLMIVLLVAVIAAPLGLIVGAVAGYFGGWVDRVLMGITDIFLSMPRLILALAFVAALGPGDRERGDRHRHHRLAGLCPHRAGRGADLPQSEFIAAVRDAGRQRVRA